MILSENTAEEYHPHIWGKSRIQGDTAYWFKPPVDVKTQVPFWPSLP